MRPDDGYIAYIVNPKAGASSSKLIGRRFEKYLVKNGYGVLTIREEEIMLEDAFIRLTDSNHEAEAAIERPTAPPTPPPPPPPPQS